MQNYTLILNQDVSTPVMRSLSKYLKSQGCQVPSEVTGGNQLRIQGPNQEQLKVVLQNYIGSASIQKIINE